MHCAWVLAALAAAPVTGSALTLREAYDAAGPGGGYDKLVVLETGHVYSGGLLIGPSYNPLSWTMEGEPGLDVHIVGNGAMLDLEGAQICISYCANRLDIEDCVVLDGNIRFRGIQTQDYDVSPVGTVRQVTFYRPHDYGVRIIGAGSGITLERNIFVDAVDTGFDFLYTNGLPQEWLPTGANVSFSVQGLYGDPVIRENWSYHADPVANADLKRHFLLLCEYG